MGVEVDIDDEDGKNKLPEHWRGIVDYIVGSSHNQPVDFLSLSDIEDEEIEEFFDTYRGSLINSFNNIPISIWGHPLLRVFQHFGDRFWKKYMLPVYEECLDVCAEQNIAIELTPQYYNKCSKQPSTFKILDEMYSLAMNNKEILFTTSSDGHTMKTLGDLTIPVQYVKKFKIPQDRLLRLKSKNGD